MTHNQRQSVLSQVDGNTLLIQQEIDRRLAQEPCPHCDCLRDHKCLLCYEFITIKDCKNNDGLCEICARDS